jgi:hypothetical protein
LYRSGTLFRSGARASVVFDLISRKIREYLDFPGDLSIIAFADKATSG